MPTCCLIDTQTTEPKREYNGAARWERYKCFLCVPKSNFKTAPKRLLRFGTAISLPISVKVGEEETKSNITAY